MAAPNKNAVPYPFHHKSQEISTHISAGVIIALIVLKLFFQPS